MNGSVAETDLISAGKKQLDLYSRALVMAEEIADARNGELVEPARLQDLLALLNDAKQVSADGEAARQQFLAVPNTPGPELQAISKTIAELINKLSVHVKNAENLAKSAMSRMAPELDHTARGRNMQKAYGQWK